MSARRPLPAVIACLALITLLMACDGSDASPTPVASTPSPTPPAAVTIEAATPAPSSTPETSGRVILNAVGDIMLARDLVTLMDENGSVYPYEAAQELLLDADLTIGNLEGTFTDRGAQAAKTYTFRTPPEHAAGLAEAGFDVVSLGNNHAMDYGEEGLTDTLAALDEAGVLHSGAGMDATEARKPVVIEKNGLTLAFLSYNTVTEATFATESSAGVAAADEASIRTDVAAALDVADLVIVSLHAGIEYVDAPSAQQIGLAQAAIQAGATLVLGHHAHVLQGWQELGDGRVIVYGLGNFVFDLDQEDLVSLGPRPFQSAVLNFEMSADGVENMTARPVFIDPAENRPIPATEEGLRQQIEARINALNDALR